MRRPLHLATALLAALTALSLLGAAVAVRPPASRPRWTGRWRWPTTRWPTPSTAPTSPSPRTTLPRSPSCSPPDFVERSSPPDAEPDGDGLVRRLLALHAVNRGPRLMAEAVAADGDLVVAAVRVAGAAPPAFLGLRLEDARTAWGPVDVLRVAGGRIAERRGPAADPVPPAPILRVPLEGPPRLVLAEAGAVQIEAIPVLGDAEPPVALRAGEDHVLPTGAGLAFADLSFCDLTGADLSGANLWGTVLAGATWPTPT